MWPLFSRWICFGFACCATLLPYFWHLATWRFPSLHEVLRFIVGGGQWLKDSWNVGEEEEDEMYTCSVWTKDYFWSCQLENIHPVSAILVLHDLRFATVQALLKESDTWRQSGTHWKMTAVGVSGMSELETVSYTYYTTLYYIVYTYLLFHSRRFFQKIFEGIIQPYVQRLSLPYISINICLTFPKMKMSCSPPGTIEHWLHLGCWELWLSSNHQSFSCAKPRISVNLLNIPLVGDWLVSHELIRIIVVLVHIYIYSI